MMLLILRDVEQGSWWVDEIMESPPGGPVPGAPDEPAEPDSPSPAQEDPEPTFPDPFKKETRDNDWPGQRDRQ